MLSELLLREKAGCAGSNPRPTILCQQLVTLYYTYFFTFIFIPLQLKDYIGVLEPLYDFVLIKDSKPNIFI